MATSAPTPLRGFGHFSNMRGMDGTTTTGCSFLQLYVAEACWKYNNRKKEELFDRFVKGCFTR